MSRSPVDHENGRFAAWDSLKPAERLEAVANMLDGGASFYAVAAATRLSVEAVRVTAGQIKAQREANT